MGVQVSSPIGFRVNALKVYEQHYKRKRKPKNRAHRIKTQTKRLEPHKVRRLRELCREVSELTGTAHHIDHKRSVVHGGGDDLKNLRIITAEANLRKGAQSC